MGFFPSAKAKAKDKKPSFDFVHRMECRACPLNKLVGNEHPNMRPTGAKSPAIYVLGEAPGKDEDKLGRQFVGQSGVLLRHYLPDELLSEIRWNNVVRTRPPHNRISESGIEIEACRPSVERDIAASKPKAVFGFGGVPLHWVSGLHDIFSWRGRRMPVQIGGHTCWYFPFVHPAALLHMRNEYQERIGITQIATEQERAFKFDMKRAIASLDKLPTPKVWTRADAQANVEIIEASASGLEKLEQLLGWAGRQKYVGFDWETFGLRTYASDAKILTAGVGTPELSFSFPLDHPGAKWTSKQRGKVDDLLRKFFAAPVHKIAHWLNFELEWAGFHYGIEAVRGGLWEDTYNQAAVLDERMKGSNPGPLSLEFLIQQYFGFNLKNLSPLNKKDLRQEPLESVLIYNGMDAKFTQLLFRKQQKRLNDDGLQHVYRSDVRRVPALVLSQLQGVPVDARENERLTKKYKAKVKAAEEEIYAQPVADDFKKKFGETFNPASNSHMNKMITRILGVLDVDGTDKEALKQIDHPVIHAEIKRREAAKVLSTYITPYSPGGGLIWPDGKIHPIYNQPGTVSDRTSSEDPNVQNVPKRNEETKEVRKQIKAPKGHLAVSCDYGQIQPRGIAMSSGDKFLTKALWENYDIHMEWAERISRAYPAAVGGKQNFTDKDAMKKFRQKVKTWDLSLFFNAHEESSSETLGVPHAKMKPIFDEFWKTFSGVKEWQGRLDKEYAKHGSVKCLSGRLMRGPLTRFQYVNYPIQEIEAHIVIGHALRTLSERAWSEKDQYFQPPLEIHDDLTFFLPEDKINGAPALDYYVERIVDDLIAVPYDYINVPIQVDVEVGKDIYSMDKVLTAFSHEWKK